MCQTRYFYHRGLKGRIWDLWCKRKDSKLIAITSRGVEDESLEIYHYQPPKLSSTLITRIPVVSDFLLNPGTIGKRLQYTGRPTLYHCIQLLEEAHLSFNNYSDEQPQPHFLISHCPQLSNRLQILVISPKLSCFCVFVHIDFPPPTPAWNDIFFSLYVQQISFKSFLKYYLFTMLCMCPTGIVEFSGSQKSQSTLDKYFSFYHC